MEYTKEFIEDAIKNADAFIAGEFASAFTNPTEVDVLLVAVAGYIKEKYIVLLNDANYNRVDLFVSQHRVLHRFDLKICNEIKPDNFLIQIDEKFIYGNFACCLAAICQNNFLCHKNKYL
jgi:hypothetical protein